MSGLDRTRRAPAIHPGLQTLHDNIRADRIATVVATRRSAEPGGYIRRRVRSDATHAHWNWQALTYPAETLAEIKRIIAVSGEVCREAVIAEIVQAICSDAMFSEPVIEEGGP